MRILKLKIFERLFKKQENTVKENIVKGNLKVSGNYRLKVGLYYTQEEKEEYIQKSLGRKLP